MPTKRKTKEVESKDEEQTPVSEQRDRPEGNGHQEQGLVVRQPADATEWTPRFVQGVDEAVGLENAKVDFMNRVMKEDVHYGKIPGGGQKPVLLKPGAEKLNASMGLHPVLTDSEPPVRDYTGEQHGGQPFWSFRRVCRIYRQTGPREDDRMLIAQAEGSCNSFEVKYRYREEQRKCPVCGAAAILQSKGKKDGTSDASQLGFFCWRKKGGCGANFRHDDQRIISQKVGRVQNMDVFDLENTGLKMADKRALVASTLLATGFSTLFTQDLDDKVPDADGAAYAEGAYPEAQAEEPQPASKAQAAPPAPPQKELTPEEEAERLVRQVMTSLGNTLDPQWTRQEYADAYEAMGKSVPKTIGLLIELHGTQHGGLTCPHIQSIPSSVDYVYPAEDAERLYLEKAKLMLKLPEQPKDPDPDDIPF